MSVLAACAVGVCCACIAGALLGALPAARWRVPRRARARSGAPARVWLQQAGIDTSPAHFRAACVVVSAVACTLFAAVTGSLFVALVPAAAAGLLPRAYVARRRRLRMREVQVAWPDGLRDLVASISAGHSLTQAVSALVTTGPPPLRAPFARFPELARVLGTGPALEVVKGELADATSDRIIEILLVAHDRGGAIVRTILEDLLDATTRDVRLSDELETEGLETRINARAVVVLPWLVLVALTARPGPFREFYRSGGGIVTLAIAAGLGALGVVALGRLGREVPEARVFDTGGAP